MDHQKVKKMDIFKNRRQKAEKVIFGPKIRSFLFTENGKKKCFLV